MDYQTFRGTDVQDALLHVREALGTDALFEGSLAGEKLERKTGRIETGTNLGREGTSQTGCVCRLSFKRSVRVVSLDTFRVGAVEQWRRYAELIGFPFDVATNAGTTLAVASKIYTTRRSTKFSMQSSRSKHDRK